MDETRTRFPGRLVSVESSAAQGFMAPLHAHDADEAVRVLEGAITVYADGEIVHLEAGETFVVEQGIAHTFRVESASVRAVFTTSTTSPSRYEGFLRATGTGGGGAWANDDDAAVVTAVATAAQVTLLGAPGAVPKALAAALAA